MTTAGSGPSDTTTLMAWLLNPAMAAPLPPERWRELLERGQSLRIGPQILQRLAAEPGAVPAADQAEFNRLRMQRFVATTRVLRGGCRALTLLQGEGIQAVGFKGLAGVGWLHGGRPERGMADCDLLIRPADLRAALGALLAGGWQSKVRGVSLDDLIAFVASSPGSAGNLAISLAASDGTEIDLHWRIGAFDSDMMIRESRACPVLGMDVPLVRPGMALLLAIHHAIRNDFVPDEVIRDILDAAGWFAILAGDSAESDWTVATARRHGIEDAIAAVSLILQRLHPLNPAAITAPRPATPAAAEAIADHWFHQGRGEALNRDLLYLCRLEPGWRMLVGVLRSGLRYRRVMAAVEVANGEQRRSVRRRLRELLRSARSTSRPEWRRLRTLASLQQRLDP